MSGDKLKRKKLQERTLRNEMLSIGSKFHTKAMQWLNETRELYTEDSAELQNHPNSILSELKCINHERTYIAYKITALAKDKMLSPTQKLRRKLRKLEMEVKFQEEFPDEYKKFMKNMKQRLHQKPYSLNQRRKNTNGNLKNTPRHKMGRREPNYLPKGQKPSKNAQKSDNNMKIIHGHETSLQNSNECDKHPEFTKENLEKILNIAISNEQFNKLKTKLIKKQKMKNMDKQHVCNVSL